MTEVRLVSLRDQPWALLREMERRALASIATVDDGAASREWVGIAFRLGTDNFITPRDEVREIVVCPATLTRVPGARPWVTGLASLRGQLLTVIDLKAFLGGGALRRGRDTRVLVINHRELSVGLLVDEVDGFRLFLESERRAAPTEGVLRCRRYLQGAFAQGETQWAVFSLQALAEAPGFLHAASDD